MKNIKKIVAFALIASAFASVHASTLYWQVQEGTTDQSFDYALLKATDGNTVTTVAGATAESGANGKYVSLQNTELGQYGNDSYSFFVEMANYSNGTFTPVAKGATYSYNDLVSAGYVATGLIDSVSASAAASNFNMGAVPEPSSGLLLLMGGAMLALRRRRQK